MKKMLKRIVASAFALAMVVTAVPASANPSTAKAEEMQEEQIVQKTYTETVKGVKYTYVEHPFYPFEVVLIKIENVGKKLVIPNELGSNHVFAIGNKEDTSVISSYAEEHFEMTEINGKNYPVLESIEIPDGVKDIGTCAFADTPCKKLSIPGSVRIIGSSAFENNNGIKTLTIRNDDVDIRSDAFSGCSKLQEIQWKKKTFTGKIGIAAFGGCALKKLHFPYMKNMEKQIGRFAFSRNEKLKKVTFDKRAKKIKIGDEWFTDCPNSEIVVGKKVKTFASEVNSKAGSVRLLGKDTKLEGFIMIAKNEEGYYKRNDDPVNKKYRYYIQYKKFYVPKKSKALPILKKAYYGIVTKGRYNGAEHCYYGWGNPMKKVKVVVK